MTSAVASRRYWSFQFAGWLGYSAIGLAINLGGAPESQSRLGLANVRDRLRLLYGDRASVHLEGADDRVRATVLIPASR